MARNPIYSIYKREPFRRDAEKIILLIAGEEAEGYITANSVTDIYYIARIWEVMTS